MKINRKFFYDYIRANLFDGSLTKKQVEGLNLFLNYWEKNQPKNAADKGIWFSSLL